MIREGTPEDELALRALQGLLPEASPVLLSHALSGKPLVLVSADGDEPVGYLLSVLDDQAYLAELAVAPPYRREGRGSALISAFLREARNAGCEYARLMVKQENDSARALYREFGFESEERLLDYYDDGPGILMRRRL